MLDALGLPTRKVPQAEKCMENSMTKKENLSNSCSGGYQVCARWLQDRTLFKDDIARNQKIVITFSESIRLEAKIDKEIDKHVGWPGAFQSAKQG